MHRLSGWAPWIVSISRVLVVGIFAPHICAAATVAVDIPAGPASSAINQLARETGLEIIYLPPKVETVRTQRLEGAWEPREALRRLLDGTGLTYREVGGGTLFVERIESDSHQPTQPRKKEISSGTPDTVFIRAKAVHGVIPNLTGIDPLMVGREEIERSGLETTAELINTLPQNFGGGPNEGTVRGNEAQTNSSFGSGVNLRGLSDDGTIVLVNGHRLAPSGTVGAFTDIGNLPLAAIDRMEVIPEGTTALYGVDAIGGIVNFVTREDVGFETRAEVGGLTKGAMYEERLGQSYGTRWDTGHLFALFDYDERDALPAYKRRLATSDLEPFGGQNFDTIYGNPGTIETFSPTRGYITFAIPHGQNGTGLQSSQFVPGGQNLYDQYAGATLLPRQQLSSLLFSGKQDLSASTTLFVDGLYNQRLVRSTSGGESFPVTVTNTLPVTVPETNAYYINPSGGTGPVTVFYNFGRDLGPVITEVGVNSAQLTGGMDHEGGLFDSLEFYTSFAFERQHQIQSNVVNPNVLAAYINDANPDTALNVFGDGSYTNPATLAQLRSQAFLTLNSRLGTLDFRALRTLFHTRAGAATLRLNEEYRRQLLDSVSVSPGDPPVSSELSRTTVSTFAQFDLPLVGAENRRKGLEKLDLSFAARYEHYSDVGAVTAPQFAVGYKPLKRILLRGTWARLAHAPDLPNLSETNNISTLYLLPEVNPQNPKETIPTATLIWNGNNSELKAETAKSWTLGLNVLPLEGTNLSFGMTYFHTNFTNRISDPIALPADVLIDSDLHWLVRPVTPAQVLNVCTHSHFLGSPGACSTTPVGAIVDLRIQNVASLDLQGVDVAVQYEWHPGASIWKFKLNATDIFQYLQQQTPSTTQDELVSTVHNPIDIRFRAGLTWARRGLWAAGYLNFQNRYWDNESVPERSIGAWATVDSALGYDFHIRRGSENELTSFSVGARNLFNHYPPFVNNQYGIGYDQENASLAGRSVRVEVRQRW